MQTTEETAKVVLSIYVTPATRKKLRVAAAEHGESLSALVERAVQTEIARLDRGGRSPARKVRRGR